MTINLEDFLFTHLAKKTKKGEDKISLTHTRIGSAVGDKPKIFGGSYSIPADKLDEFHKLYFANVIQCGIPQYLTEKQNENDGKIYIDLDFRYLLENSKRHHDFQWVNELVCSYVEKLKTFYKFEDGSKVDVYIMERDDGYIDMKKNIYKDGLHIIIDVNMPRRLHLLLREQMINDEDVIELFNKLPLTNSLEDVFDKGLSTGTTNAQMFGSQKPNREPYKLTNKMKFILDGTDNEWCVTDEDVSNEDTFFQNFKALSVQTQGAKFELSGKSQTQLLKLDMPVSPSSISELPNSGRVCVKEYEEYVEIIDIRDINHYPTWSKLVWAFHSMGDEFKPVALKMTKRSHLYQEEEYFNKIWDCAKTNGKATKEYIWGSAKRGNCEKYIQIRLAFNPIVMELFIDACISGTDVKIANLFIDLYGDNYKCVSSKNKTFHEFNSWVNGENFWKCIDGSYKIQNKLEDINAKFQTYKNSRNYYLQTLDKNGEEYEKVKKQNGKMMKTIELLEGSNKISCVSKIINNKIMDEDFEKGMNKVKDNLIPIKNNKMFNTSTLKKTDRTIANKFNYYCEVDFKDDISEEEMNEMDDYFKALFNNNDDTKQIMVTIFKSIFSGVTFRNIFFFTGDGSNGKSLLFKLLGKIFGKAVDVISNDVMIEKKGNSSINTELAKLQTTLLGYITELKERDELNTTMIKKISGGDPIDYRGLFNGNKTIEPTTNLCALTNKMPYFEVEPAIMKRMIVAPMNTVFDIDPTFETKMLGKLDLLFTYIMKQGKIITSIKDSDLTDEMKSAIKDYKEDNVKDYLNDFIKRHYKTVDWNEKEMTKIEKTESRTECDEFLTHYKQYLKENNYKPNYDSKNKFSRNMKKYHSIGTYQSNHKPYYTGFVRKYGEDEEDDDDM